MEPLVVRRDHKAWLCWKDLVKLMAFTTKHSYVVATAQPHLDELVDNFEKSFAAVKEWRTFHKPKQHLPRHLQLDEFGPFRAYWYAISPAFPLYTAHCTTHYTTHYSSHYTKDHTNRYTTRYTTHYTILL
jgi:hypothetical protein